VLEAWLPGKKKRLHPCALYAPRMFARVNDEDNLEEKYLCIWTVMMPFQEQSPCICLLCVLP
jgi:hypothetical protein